MSAVLAASAPPPDVTGYVEAATADAVLGWAWAPRSPETRVTVELSLDGKAVASATADVLREDLARNGIGDGRHAFRVTIPEAFRARSAEIRVAARAGGGEPVLLGQPPAPESVTERLDRLQRGLDMVVASQRVLHRNIQAALLQNAAAHDGAPEKDEFRDHMRSLEVFAVRLDERLAAMAPQDAAAAHRGFGGRRAAAAACLVAVLLCSALGVYVSVAG